MPRAQRGHHTPRLLHSGYARGRMGERHQGQSDRGLLSGQGLHPSDAGSRAGRHGALFLPGPPKRALPPSAATARKPKRITAHPRRGSSRSSSRWQWSLPPYGIRVNGVAPGPVQGTMIPKESWPVIAEKVPLNRLGTPEEMAEGAWFLCSPQAAFITGHILDINGGTLMD